MNLTLKYIDINGWQNLKEYRPDVEDNFIATVNLRIGPADHDGGHDYSLTVCSVKRLNPIVINDGPVFGRHFLIVNRYDSSKIKASVNRIMQHCYRLTFEESSAILARFLAWEYEDYKQLPIDRRA